MHKKFTLLICSYNPNKKWLAQAIKSVQGIFDEYILVDDGSKEPIVCPNNFTLLRQNNGGLWTARNLGINNATGDIICLLDDDDWLDGEEVKKMCKFVEDNYDNGDIFTHDFYVHRDTGEVSIRKSGYCIEKILEKNQYVGTTWYKKSVWEKLGGYSDAIAEDWDFWMRAIKNGLKIIEYGGVFYHYRKRKGSVSFDWVGDKFLEIKQDINNRYYNK